MRVDKKGFALILGFIVATILTIIGTAAISRTISESRLTRQHVESTQAFWMAEAGVAKAIKELPATDTVTASVTLGEKQGTYSATAALVSGYSSRYTITSVGSVDNLQRTVEVVVEVSEGTSGADPSLIDYAIETTGGLTIKGSVDINPDGSNHSESTLDFQEVFGATKDEIKALADRVYTNPSENQQPVEGVTWVDLTGTTPDTATTYKISSNWSGSGLLIIDGHRNETTDSIAALEISGSWSFSGMIWVIGKLKISGTPIISGGVFAESSVDVDSTLTGNATLNFSADAVGDAFSLLGSASSTPTIISWREL